MKHGKKLEFEPGYGLLGFAKCLLWAGSAGGQSQRTHLGRA